MFEMNGFSSLSVIYEGRNTIIYTGKRLSDHKSVILKTTYTETKDQQSITQLIHEYNILKQIENKDKESHVIHLLDLIYENNVPILVFENAGEITLRAFLHQSPLSIDLFLDFAIQLTKALEEIHIKKITHRDIKPDNIIINLQNKKLTLIDFSVSTRISQNMVDEDLNLDYLKGSLAYMSPEQTGRLNRSVDYRTDFYSLGITFYEMLTGKLPFNKKDPLEIIYSHLAEIPTPPHLIRQEIPEQLSNLILRLMSKTPEERYTSAIGIAADLQNCLTQWNESKTIQFFPLGTKDTSDKFQISQKLYGRSQEITKLLSFYENINKKKRPSLLLLSGVPGIGKTSVVKELYKPISYKKGYFIQGKFDQNKRSTPYSAFVEAFENLIHRILKGSRDDIEEIKNRLLHELGNNAQLIIDLVPSLELLLGHQPPLPEVSPHAIQNRFIYTIQNFIRTIAQPGHPLLIFIDDWQWADSGSLKLLKSIMIDPNIHNLLIIASYRDDKKADIYPFLQTVDILKEQKLSIQTIHLFPLTSVDIQNLIMDNFNLLPTETGALASLLLEKTQGNPFFINMFLEMLHKNNLFTFSPKTQKWEWDFELIKQQSYTDNVVNLVVSQLHQLPPKTQEILKVAACIGHIFDARLLSPIMNIPLRDILHHLLPALENNFIFSSHNNHEYYEELESLKDHKEQDPKNSLKNDAMHFTTEGKICYRFCHDRIQQACISLFDALSLKETHLAIGRYLRDNPQIEDLISQLGETVQHLNYGGDLITDPLERSQIAELNLVVGQRSKTVNAYELSLDYFLTGIGHLTTEAWEKEYSLIFRLYHEVAHSQFLCGDFESAENLFNFLVQKARSTADKITVYLSLGHLYIGKPDYEQSIIHINKALELIGHKLPRKISKLTLGLQMIHLAWLLKGKSINNVIDIPEITDSKLILVLQMHNILGLPTVLTNPYLFMMIVLRSLKITVQNGNSPYGISAYLGYAAALLRNRLDCSIKTEQKAFKYIDISLKLLEKYNIKSFRTEYYQFYGLSFHSRRHPLRDCYRYFEEAYIASQEDGNLIYAAHNLHHMESSLFLAGEPIPKLVTAMKTMIEGINISNGREELACLLLVKQFHASLLDEKGGGEWYFNQFRGRELAQYPLDNNLYKTPAHYAHRRSFFDFLMGHYEAAQWHYEQLTLMKKKAYPCITFLWINYYFIYPLTLAALYKNASFFQKLLYKRQIRQFLKILKMRSRTNPENHLNKYYLVLAEQARLNKDMKKAIYYYSHSIQAAKKYGFLHEEAIAYELQGKFYIEIGGYESASHSLTTAYLKFEEWGSKAKTTQLIQLYPNHINKYIQTPQDSHMTFSDINTITNNTIISDVKLNMSSIMKASQVISSEIEISKLLDKLLSVLLENAGAQRVVLISLHRDHWMVEAEGSLRQKYIYEENPIPIDTRQDLPLTLISYINYTKKFLIIDNASESDMGITGTLSQKHTDLTDPYLKKGTVKSVLLLPILYQGQLKHICYMENNAISGAFTLEHLQTVQFLASQAAISLENAHLYKQATHDPLTGLGNRNLLYSLFPRSVSRAKREGNLLAIAFMDLDFFKTINDTLGHEIGDEILIHVSKLLKMCVRESDLVVRLGGDEFVLLLEDIDSKQQVKEIIERFFSLISQPVTIKGHSIMISSSMGISLYPSNGESILDLLNKADITLYEVKESGRNRFDFYQTKSQDPLSPSPTQSPQIKVH